MQTALPPIFIKANIVFSINGREYSFLNQGVSIYGVSGIRWNFFDPIDKVGFELSVTIDVLARVKYRFSTKANVTAETTSDATYLGMKFQLNDFERTRLAAVIRNEGYYPTEYIRKYPRIPAKGIISSMPLHSIVTTDMGENIAFQIANMSPNGILLHTENPNANIFLPGGRLYAQVDPRGSSFQPFHFEGLICRVFIERNIETKNFDRFLGIRFLRINEVEKQNFLEILRAVLNNIMRESLTD